ncbi:MAG: metallophosphoesterase family protein [Clostridiales bacterium]|nr:metallophosphoesterase family protein [Clostridiales bacterium]
MRKSMWKKPVALALAAAMLATSSGMTINAAVPDDGYTDATTTVEAYGSGYSDWEADWDALKDDWTQMTLTQGCEETQLNFAWYSTGDDVPQLKIGVGKKMKNAQVYTATQTDATEDSDGVQYKSNKVTATGLEAETTYYYSYQVDGKWTTPEAYTTQSTDSFGFIFVGDPQIGSSNPLKGEDTEEFYDAQSESVANDTFNWNTTLTMAMEKTDGSASFILSAGDQIQTTLKKSPNNYAWVSEIEYAGYLSPDVLDNVPVATTVGNHDSDNPNYTYHFNTPNSSDLGSSGSSAGGDYWFTYGDALFIMLNTQSTNVTEHKQFIEEAVEANPDCTWRIVTLHQDIYGSAEHSNEPEITNLRYTLVPYFEEYDIDVVLMGHDHAYSRSQILKGGTKTVEYSEDDYEDMFDVDIESEDTTSVFVSNTNISDDTTDPDEIAYLTYIGAVMDADAVVDVDEENNTVVDPDGILYITANSSSGSKYYDLVGRQQTYIAARWQEDVPTYSVIDMTEDTFTINTYRTDTDDQIDETYTIKKTSASADNNDENSGSASGSTDTTDTSSTASKISNAVISGVKNKTYTGSEITQTLTVKDADGNTLKEGTNYKVSYANNVKVGTATVTITGTGKYTGTKKATFTIKPKKVTSVKVASNVKKKATVSYKKVKGGVTGYEITYSLKKNFSNSKTKKTTKLTATLKNLKSKKTYYVKIRAYKKTGSTVIYGKYSKVKKVTVK